MKPRHSPSAAGPAVMVVRSSQRGLQTYNIGVTSRSARLGARGGDQGPQGSAGDRKRLCFSFTQPLAQPLKSCVAIGVNLSEDQILHLECGVNDSFSGRMVVSKAFPPDLTYRRCSGNCSYCQRLPGLNPLLGRRGHEG